jgi:hypothetical protein
MWVGSESAWTERIAVRGVRQAERDAERRYDLLASVATVIRVIAAAAASLTAAETKESLVMSARMGKKEGKKRTQHN